MTEQKTHERQNRFSGESIMLTKTEAKIHDSIFYYEYLATLEDKKVGFDGHSKLWDKENDVYISIQEYLTTTETSDVYGAYEYYIDQSHGKKFIVSKGFFEKGFTNSFNHYLI